MTATPLIFADCETTGLCPDIHVPWEIAWTTAVHRDGVLELNASRVFYVELTERQLRLASPAALDIGRFHQRYGVGQGQRPIGYLDVVMILQADTFNVSRQVEGEPLPHLVGAVPSFDHNMLCHQWLGWPDFGEGLWHYHLIDVETLAAGKLNLPPPYSSSELTAALGIQVDESTKHTAAGDCNWAIQMYAAVYDLEVRA